MVDGEILKDGLEIGRVGVGVVGRWLKPTAEVRGALRSHSGDVACGHCLFFFRFFLLENNDMLGEK